MKYRFIKLFFLFSILFAVKIKGEDAGLCTSAFYKTKTANLYAANGNNNRGPHIYFLGLNGTLQMYRAQTQRGGSFVKSVLLNTAGFYAGFKSLTIIFLRSGTEHLSSCKLILFPFHDFW
ncbi:hypothetical protein [Mucilaginibacter agri]|uniref:Uncharacterized protein n=1 Tax=Mucilaginibacter agri TaxID=2695265 RepID=A0A965ZJ10_9SPHI|nr:hypothetical protein [Mucilaginibacter agri]NCD70859.1 hypothetical protein [Mucilaginibacter agri]